MVMQRWRPGREVIPWRPIRQIDQVFDDMERQFEEVFDRPFFPVTWKREPHIRAWSPAMEVVEKENEYLLKAELPGMKKDDIDISVEEDTLIIKGERRAEEEKKGEGYHLCERCYGSFERSIALPKAIESEKVKACYENGLLELTIPKAPEAQPKKVEVSIK